jgi:LysM repeat protein
MRPRHTPHLRTRLLAVVSAASILTACSTGAGADYAAAPSTSAVASAAPTTVAPTTTVPAPICTVTAQPGDSLISIAERNGITLEQLETENLLDPTDIFHPGQVFDVCVGDAAPRHRR